MKSKVDQFDFKKQSDGDKTESTDASGVLNTNKRRIRLVRKGNTFCYKTLKKYADIGAEKNSAHLQLTEPSPIVTKFCVVLYRVHSSNKQKKICGSALALW